MDKPEHIRIEFGGDGVTIDDILSSMRVVTIESQRIYAAQFLMKLAVLGVESVYGEDGSDEEKSNAADSILGALAVLCSPDELAAAMEHVREDLGK